MHTTKIIHHRFSEVEADQVDELLPESDLSEIKVLPLVRLRVSYLEDLLGDG